MLSPWSCYLLLLMICFWADPPAQHRIPMAWSSAISDGTVGAPTDLELEPETATEDRHETRHATLQSSACHRQHSLLVELASCLHPRVQSFCKASSMIMS